MKPRLLKPSKEPEFRRHLMPFKVSDAERKLIQQKAKAYTAGNVSEVIRIAILKFKPKREDFQK